MGRAFIPDILLNRDLSGINARPTENAYQGCVVGPMVNSLLAVRELPFAVRGYDKLLVWHERSHADPAQQWLRDQLATTAKAV